MNRRSHLWLAFFAAGALLVPGCTDDAIPDDPTIPEAEPDSDGDGLWDSFEDQIGTSSDEPDTDGDGYDDGEEWDLYTNPLDALDYEYEGGWAHHPYPAGLTGGGIGDNRVIDDIKLFDYYGQQVQLYTFYGNVILVAATADS